jgi:solute carrier family 25 protein 39/40
MQGTLIAVSRADGVTALWRGLQPSLLLAMPSMATYFYVYESCKQELVSRELCAPAVAPIYAGVVGRVVQATLGSPLDLVRCFLQFQYFIFVEYSIF